MSARKLGRTGSPNPRSGGPSAAARVKLQAELAARQRRERRILAAVVVAVVALVVGGGLGIQAWRANRAPSAPASSGPPGQPIAIDTGRPLVLGSASAPVTVGLYEDFHCPHCADFEDEFGPVLTEARDSGKVKTESYPMAFIDEGSLSAANAMACAAEAGFGPRYYDALFANHTLAWSDPQLLDLGRQVNGSLPDTFATCVRSRAHGGWVQSINAAADTAGVDSTPTLFVDGQRVDITGLTPDQLRARLRDAAGS